MKPSVVASLILLGSVSGLFAADYTWNPSSSETWQAWGDAANWLVDGATPTAAPGADATADDLVKRNNQGKKVSWCWDLGGGEYTIAKLFTDSWCYDDDSFSFRNGSLTVSSALNFLDKMSVVVESGATLSLYNATIGVNSGNNRCKLTVKDGGALEIHGNFWPRCADFEIEEGGSWLYGADVTLQNCNKNFLWYLNNRGTATFENGLCKFSNTWSAPWKICQLAGEMVWGGPFKVQNNLYYQIELTGGKVSATGDVSFTYDSARDNYFKFTDGADLDIEVADGKTLDLTPFTYDGAATIRKRGAGVLKLADVPTAISMKGGAVTFAANSQTAMTSLEIGEGQSFTVASKNTTIDKLVALDGSLTLAAAGLTVKEYAADSVAGTISVTTATYATGDVIITTPSAELRAAVKAAAQAVEMNVDEDGETLTVGESDYVFNSTTVTDLSDASGWKLGTLPPEGVSVTISGEGVKAVGTASSLAAFKSVTVANGADLSVSGEATLPPIVLESTASLTISSGATVFLSDFSTLLNDDSENIAATLPELNVESGATLKLAAGMTFKNVSLDFRGNIAKVDSEGAVSTDGVGPIFGYAEAGETSYVAIQCDGATFDVHSNQNAENGRVNFVNPVSGGRVKVVGDIVLKNTKFPISGWADFGNRYFGENNPTDEPFTVILDGTTIEAPWSFIAAGAARIRAINGSIIQKPLACAGHWLSNYIKDIAQVEVIGVGAYFDYVGNDGQMRVNSSGECDAMILRDGAAYLVGNASGTGKGVLVAANALVGVGKQWSSRVRSDLLEGFGSARIESESTMTVCPLDWGIGNTDWERRAKFANIPLTGEGDLIVSNGAPTKVFTVTVVNGNNTCSGAAKVVPPVVAAGETAAETSLFFANGANWAGTVEANGYLALTNMTDATDSAAVTFGGVKLTSALPLRVWREEDGSITSDTITLTDGFVVEEGDAGIVELVGQDGFELAAGETVALGTFPTGAFANVTVKCGGRKLSVVETATATEGVVTCKAKRTSGFKMIIR